MNFGEVSIGVKHLWMGPIEEAFVTASLKTRKPNN
jgi:hypothetical protein